MTLGPNWKTTVSGLVTMVMSFVLFSNDIGFIVWPKWALGIAMFAFVGGMGAFGVTARDYNVNSAGQKVVAPPALSVVPKEPAPAVPVRPEPKW